MIHPMFYHIERSSVCGFEVAMAHRIFSLLSLVVAIAAIAFAVGSSAGVGAPQKAAPLNVTGAQQFEHCLKKMVGQLNTTFTQYNAPSKLRESFWSQLRKNFPTGKPEDHRVEDFKKLKGHLNTTFNHFNATANLRESIWTQLHKGFTEMQHNLSQKQPGNAANART